MEKPIIEWDGEHVPGGLRGLPPGRYQLEPVEVLTDVEDAGIVEALGEIDAGQGRSLNDVIAEIRGRRA